MSLHASAAATLRSWAAPTPAQEEARLDYLEHLMAHDDAVWRSGPPEHLTASCFVLDAAGGRTLLTLHRKGRFWAQLGGHCEQGDATLADVALREAREESGIEGLRLLPGPADLHRHTLSSAFGRCMEHLDVAYVAIAEDGCVPSVSAESDDVAWWNLDALPPTVVPDLPDRLARVLAARFAAEVAVNPPPFGPDHDHYGREPYGGGISRAAVSPSR